MELTIICPVYNEILFVDELVKNLCSNDGLEKEILIVDGGSTDGTPEQVEKLKGKYSNLHLLDNPQRTSTHAFNLAFLQAKGKYISFVGAHAQYDTDYFKNGLNYLRAGECDAVGGPLRQEGKTNAGRAIALVMSHKFGVGNSEFRTMKEKMFVDSVAFAIYKREAVEKAGPMDEALPVNQDDEFHYRLRKLGFRILMVPEMKAIYYVRGSYCKLFKQYFRYGLYKPLVLRKAGGPIRLRHLAPAAFTVYLLSLPLAFLWIAWLLPLALYFIFILLTVLSFNTNLSTKLLCIPVFPVLHVSYGSGFLLGMFR